MRAFAHHLPGTDPRVEHAGLQTKHMISNIARALVEAAVVSLAAFLALALAPLPRAASQASLSGSR
jgi:hypothetical protein